MAGIAELLSAVSPFLAQGFNLAQQGARPADASTSRPALIPAALSPATSRAFVAPAVATVAGSSPNGAPLPAVQNQPPQVIVETNYIIYTTVKTLPPAIVTVTQTQQPPPPPPPPPVPPPPPKEPPSPPRPPNAVPLAANPDSIAAPILLSQSSVTPKTTPQLAAASPVPQPPPALGLVPPPAQESSSPPATTLINQTPPPPVLAPVMSSPGSGRGGGPPPNPQAQAGPPSGGPPMGPPDPANGAFPGGVPTKNLDLPVTIMFMLLFMLGAYVHISIYRANAKRGHKFLISDIIFDFCMLRTVTCIFRITWSIVTTRGVILVALITENGGAALLFAVNIFFAQRLLRSIHPKAGWCTAASQTFLLLLFSVPVFILFNGVNLIISFFSVGNLDRLEATDDLIKFGSGYNMFLAAFPVIVVAGCLCIPGPEPEKFGTGSMRVKVALLFFGSFLLMAGHAIRVYALVNKEPPGTDSVIYGKAVFYTTGFLFELLVVAVYAFGRVDLRFHVPNGASGPGDYSGDRDKGNYSVEEIERLIDDLDVPHQIMRERKGPEDMEMVFAIFFAAKKEEDEKKDLKDGSSDDATVVAGGDSENGSRPGQTPLPERPRRITRRQTLIDAFRPPPPRPEREPTMYPDITDFYVQMDDGRTPRRPMRPSMYSSMETGQGYNNSRPDQRVQQYWGASPPYGNEKEAMKNVDLR
ncbi:hypothetical protein CGCS363_v003948 [Colletotrichum siamense]|uniref:uncharacterized protein n=1 Tax=Colletotrichum siamense TaxID=690259 RepID=UPI0018723579|nr:uncharacterized protein CGCS363_v003948 [Colletotrichum siamense]KAF5510703.1 hypothetical protein CGCS363_v003948 [Colletotrichum siamense]